MKYQWKAFSLFFFWLPLLWDTYFGKTETQFIIILEEVAETADIVVYIKVPSGWEYTTIWAWENESGKNQQSSFHGEKFYVLRLFWDLCIQMKCHWQDLRRQTKNAETADALLSVKSAAKVRFPSQWHFKPWVYVPSFFSKINSSAVWDACIVNYLPHFCASEASFSLRSSKREGAGWGISQKQILILRSNCTCERIFAADDSYTVKGCSKN